MSDTAPRDTLETRDSEERERDNALVERVIADAETRAAEVDLDPVLQTAPATKRLALGLTSSLLVIVLAASFPSEPSGPGARPNSRAARARDAVHSFARWNECSPAIAWRTTDSCDLPWCRARSTTRSARPARCGYQE